MHLDFFIFMLIIYLRNQTIDILSFYMKRRVILIRHLPSYYIYFFLTFYLLSHPINFSVCLLNYIKRIKLFLFITFFKVYIFFQVYIWNFIQIIFFILNFNQSLVFVFLFNSFFDLAIIFRKIKWHFLIYFT